MQSFPGILELMGRSGCYFINMEYDNLHLHKSLSFQFHIHPSHLASYRGQGEKIQQVSIHSFPHHPLTLLRSLIIMQIFISITRNPQKRQTFKMNPNKTWHFCALALAFLQSQYLLYCDCIPNVPITIQMRVMVMKAVVGVRWCDMRQTNRFLPVSSLHPNEPGCPWTQSPSQLPL